MKKKIFLLGAIIVLLLSLSISAGAAEIFSLNCDGMEDEISVPGWKDSYSTNYGYYEAIDEKIHMSVTMNSEGGKETLSMRIPYGIEAIEGEALLFYDVMFPSSDADCKQKFYMQYYYGNSKRMELVHNPSSFAVGEWYNVMVHADLVNNVAYYRTRKAAVGESPAGEWSGKSAATFKAEAGKPGFKAYCIPSNEYEYTHRGEAYFDNIRVIQDLYLENFKFMLDDTEITSIEDITEAGTVKAVFDVMNYDLDYNNSGIVPDVTEFTPMVVAFDKDGMMLDCAIFEDIELEEYDNIDKEFGLDISGIQEQLSGGTIKLYIWDSIDNMETIFDEFVIPATAE